MLVEAAIVAYFLALTLWVGGLIILFTLVAPAVFRASPSKTQAGKTFGEILRCFNFVEFACVLVLMLSYVKIYQVLNFPLLMDDDFALWVIRVRALLILLMFIILLIYGIYLNPKLQRLRIGQNINFDEEAGETNRSTRLEFDKLQKVSVILVTMNIVLGVVLLITSCLSIANILE